MSNTQAIVDDRMDPTETAALIGVRRETLALWRCTGRHDLQFTRVGRKIYYSRGTVTAWLARHTATSTAALAIA